MPSSAPIRTSADSSSIAPAAIALPLQATTVGRGKPSSRLKQLAPAISISGHCSPGTRRSKPADNVRSRPVRTTTASSCSARSSASLIEATIAGDSALTLPSSRVMVAMPSSSA